MVSTQQMLQAVDGQISAVSSEQSALQKLQRGLEGDIARIDGELEQAWAQLAEVLVPALDVNVLNRVSAELKLPAVAGRVVEQQLTTTVAQQREKLRKLTDDPLFTKGEEIANEASIHLADLEEAMDPLLRSTSELEAAPYFEELLQYRYGTPEYAVKFYQLLYYTHWKHADLIVEAHGPRFKVATFSELAAKYVDEKSASRQLAAEHKKHQDRRASVAAQKNAVDETTRAIQEAAPRMLASVRGRVRQHLTPLGDADLAKLLAWNPDADIAWKRVAGLKKKQEYLHALISEQVKAPLSDLSQMAGKLHHARNKLARPKNMGRSWTQQDYQRYGVDRRDKWHKRRARIGEARTHIVEFHHYDRWSPTSDFLWWDLMSDGQLDGNFISEVRARPHHMHHHHHHDRDSFTDTSRDLDVS